MVSRALISVSDKTGIIELSQFLAKKNIEILSTGGTAKLLREHNITVQDISDFTGFPEVFDGRVKTLHPKVHGGLLYVRENEQHVKTARENNIEAIDLVVVNLYPFEQTIKKKDISEAEVIENIDIGGPSMLRSAAKNFKSVTVLTDPKDYTLVQKEIETHADTTMQTRKNLAIKAFIRTAEYDDVIAQFFHSDFFALSGHKIQDLRYGENPHQKAAFYQINNPCTPSIPTAQKLQGKELSFNNILDANAALSVLLEFSRTPAAVVLKHLIPCGAAIGNSVEEAFTKAHSADSVSIFGGIVAVNKEVSLDLAEKLVKIFLEIIIAPSFSDAAKDVFAKKKNLRLLQIDDIQPLMHETEIRSVIGGFLVQDLDTKQISRNDLKVMTKLQPTAEQIEDLLFAWKVCKHVKSNAIVLANNKTTVGICGGQTSRVDAAEIAVKKAEEKALGAVCASDAFFPFTDGVEALAQAGVKAVVQPGGAKRDEQVIARCDELGMAMVFTGTRAFLH